MPKPARTQVLIVGAGPTGLVLALWLTRLGVAVKILDAAAEPGTTSRAVAVQARTLELYGQMGLAEAVVEAGHKTGAVNFWARGEKAARIPLTDIGEGLSPYPFLLMYPQDRHERLLIARLAALGVKVERPAEVEEVTLDEDGVTARWRRPGGAARTVAADYVCGCDGAHSVVRRAVGEGFPGGTYRQLFYVADVDARGPPADGELHVDLDEADFLAVFPLDGGGRVRLIGTVRDQRAEHPEALGFADVSGNAIAHMKLEVGRVNWFSTYRVHHRVAERFRQGRAFLLGDAAHIHSPAGGQGMNTGLGDAINLAWKLAAVLDGRATPTLLDSYEAERMAFAKRLVATTDRAFSFASAEGWAADLVRTRVAPLVISRALSIEAVREFAYRTVAQITLNYRGGPLSLGKAGGVCGGDRLPWAVSEGHDSFAPLGRMAWQAHVFGLPRLDFEARCREAGLPLHITPWRAPHGEAGLAQDAIYLTRPDSYVAVADPEGEWGTIEAYAAERGLRLAG